MKYDPDYIRYVFTYNKDIDICADYNVGLFYVLNV